MNSHPRIEHFEKRFQRVIDYIYDHLDDELDLMELADIACMSPHHWHRIYAAMYGETIAATVKRLRLHRAAGMLANSKLSIAQITKKSGYANVQSFTRVFKSVYGQPPASYRQSGSHTQFKHTEYCEHTMKHKIRIQETSPMKVAGLDHKGHYMEIGRAFEKLHAWISLRELASPELQMLAIFYDDPSCTPVEELRSFAGVLIKGEFPVEEPVRIEAVAGGKRARFLHQGPYADMNASYQWLFGSWLPQSGEEPGDHPCFETYLNSPHDTAPADLLTEINISLQ